MRAGTLAVTGYRTGFALLLTFVAFAAASTPAQAMLVISKRETRNMNCSGGVCTTTDQNAVLNANELAGMLAASDVKVFAEGPATNIKITAPFSWVSGYKLTLGAYKSVLVEDAVTAAGPGSLTISTNVGGTGGNFTLSGKGKISFWDLSSTLVLNDVSYTLVSDIASLASAIASNPAGIYAFARDYDARQDGSYAHSPIPTPFVGTLEGLGNAIENLTIYNDSDSEEKVALFSELGSGGQLSDFHLKSVSMQIYGAYAATLVAVNNGNITNASATGTMSALVGRNWSTSGLVYQNNGTIMGSQADVSLPGSSFVSAGLAAYNSGLISSSHASGSIAAIDAAGGLVVGSTGTIADSYAQGSVTISSRSDAVVGGLVASSSGPVQRCFATGAVSREDSTAAVIGKKFDAPRLPGVDLGGLVGRSSGPIAYSYATGSVTPFKGTRRSRVGGLVGETEINGTILQSYSLGALKRGYYLGGVIGYDGAAPNSNDTVYWDLDTSGVEDRSQGAGNVVHDPGIEGLSEAEFRSVTIGHFNQTIWVENPNINNGYPYLRSNPPPKQ